MGEPNAALNVYMSKKERIRDVFEYYMGERIPAGYEISTEDDFKYRFTKKDRLRPVCNLKLYWGKKREHMPESLGDMMDMEGMPEQMRHLFNDYRVHTVCMRYIRDEDLEKMASDMKYVIGVLKRTERGKNYQQFILEHADYFKRMPADAYEVIRVCANIKEIKKEFMFREDGGEERVDMCRAIYEIKRDARREGKREGRCEAILELLEDCGEVPEEIKRQIIKEKNRERLGLWLKLAAKAESIEEFCMAM